MGRLFIEKTLLIATGNAGKLREIEQLFFGFDITIASTKPYALQEPEETGSNFIENAMIKACYYGERTGLAALADDSGLCIDLLNGEPGIYSARFAKDGKDFPYAFSLIQERLGGKESSAHFICALALRFPDGHIETTEGRVDGSISFPPRGSFGHGYDPIFIPNGYDVTFAQMQDEQKNNISHRAEAFKKLMTACFYENRPQMRHG